MNLELIIERIVTCRDKSDLEHDCHHGSSSISCFQEEIPTTLSIRYSLPHRHCAPELANGPCSAIRGGLFVLTWGSRKGIIAHAFTAVIDYMNPLDLHHRPYTCSYHARAGSCQDPSLNKTSACWNRSCIW